MPELFLLCATLAFLRQQFFFNADFSAILEKYIMALNKAPTSNKTTTAAPAATRPARAKPAKGLFAHAFLAARNTMASAMADGKPAFSATLGWPVNAATGKPYTGINAFLLSVQAQGMGLPNAFVGSGDAFDKGWESDPHKAISCVGVFNGVAARKSTAAASAAEVDPETATPETASEKSRPGAPMLLTFSVGNIGNFGLRRPKTTATTEQGIAAMGLLPTEAIGSVPYEMACHLIHAVTGTALPATKKEVFNDIVGRISPRTLTDAAKLAQTALEVAGVELSCQPLPSGATAAKNAAAKAAAMEAAKASLIAEGTEATERKVAAATAKLLPKQPKPEVTITATSAPEMVAMRKLCLNW